MTHWKFPTCDLLCCSPALSTHGCLVVSPRGDGRAAWKWNHGSQIRVMSLKESSEFLAAIKAPLCLYLIAAGCSGDRGVGSYFLSQWTEPGPRSPWGWRWYQEGLVQIYTDFSSELLQCLLSLIYKWKVFLKYSWPCPTADPIATECLLNLYGAAQLVSQRQYPRQRRLEIFRS